MLQQYVNLWTLVLCIWAILLYFLYNLCLHGRTPQELPWVGGADNKLGSRMKAAMRALRAPKTFPQMLLDAEKSYLSKGRACITTNLIDGPIVLLPHTDTRWLVNQSRETLSFPAAHSERFQLAYTLTHSEIVQNPLYAKLILKILKRDTGQMVPQTYDEVRHSLDMYLGMNHDSWTAVNIFDVMTSTVAAVSNRMFVGLPLCRNTAYIQSLMTYFQLFLPFAVCIRMLPVKLRPLLGFPLKGILHIVVNKFFCLLSPLIRDVKDSVERGERMTGNDKTFARAFVEEVQKTDMVGEADSIEKLSSLLLILNFAAIHSSAETAIKTILNILCHDSAAGLIPCLLTEIQDALHATGGTWSLETLNRMKCMDSVLKESLRMDPIETLSMYRMVQKPVSTKHGCLLDTGTKVAISAYTVNRNPLQYPDPHQFDPMRFCRSSEDSDIGMSAESTRPEKAETQRLFDELKGSAKLNNASYTITEDYLSFGYGSHSCPGRWFATSEIKLIIAYMLINYEIKPLQSKASGWWIGSLAVPPTSARIMLKRKKT